jgi:hypothetical protein
MISIATAGDTHMRTGLYRGDWLFNVLGLLVLLALGIV